MFACRWQLEGCCYCYWLNTHPSVEFAVVHQINISDYRSKIVANTVSCWLSRSFTQKPSTWELRDFLDLLAPWEHQLIFPWWNWTAFRHFDSYFMRPFESLLGFTLFRGLKQLCFFSLADVVAYGLSSFVLCSAFLHHTTEQSQSLWRLSVLGAVPQVKFFHWCPLWVTFFFFFSLMINFSAHPE